MTLEDPVAWVQARSEADPVRRRVLEGLARRAAAQAPGALRDALLDRLARRARAEPLQPPARRPTNSSNPLTGLLEQLQAGASHELRNVQAHQRTWSALRLAHRMAEVAAPVPEHLGPLNSQVLVTRALQQLQALAPGYLQRLLTQLDGLAALVPLQVAADAEKPARPVARKSPARKR